MEFKYFKLEVFIPETHFNQLQHALQKVDAGHIGKYDCCLSYSKVIGTFRPLEGTHPYIGDQGEINQEPELKVEFCCKAENLSKTKAAIIEVHPYEEPVIDVIPLYDIGI